MTGKAVTITLQQVDWSDPRAVAQRDLMNHEMDALYAGISARSTPEQDRLTQAAFAIDPADIVMTMVALETADGPSAVGDENSGDETVVGHIALRPYGDRLEVKKVYVSKDHRGKGISRRLMAEVETIARDRGVTSLVLQTGSLQTAAIALYEKIGYRLIPPFRGYGVIAVALCYEKRLD